MLDSIFTLTKGAAYWMLGGIGISPVDWEAGRRGARARHREGAQFLYLDYHAQYNRPEEITVRMWSGK